MNCECGERAMIIGSEQSQQWDICSVNYKPQSFDCKSSTNLSCTLQTHILQFYSKVIKIFLGFFVVRITFFLFSFFLVTVASYGQILWLQFYFQHLKWFSFAIVLASKWKEFCRTLKWQQRKGFDKMASVIPNSCSQMETEWK